MSFWGTFARLRDQLTEIHIDWRHPSWWAAFGWYMLMEYAPSVDRDDHSLVHEYLGANGGPRADNFMGRDCDPPADMAFAIARAVIRARAAVDVVTALDGTLPEQPLAQVLVWEREWLVRREADDVRRVAFVTPHGTFTALVEGDGDADRAIASALGAVVSETRRPADPAPPPLTWVDPEAAAPTPAAIAVAIGCHPLPLCAHVHRRAWTKGGGPWFGVGDAPPLEVATTCHVAVDGYGHALLTDRLFRRCDAGAAELPRLAAAARLALGDSPRPVEPVSSMPAAEPLNFARCFLDSGAGTFMDQSYAFGRALERRYRDGLSNRDRRSARTSPTFQVPVAPGHPDDPDRRRHRVVHGLLSVRMRDGEFESRDAFEARIPAFLAREMSEGGLVTMMQRSVASLRVPREWRRRLLQSRHASPRFLLPYGAIVGRGRMSSMRFPAHERPAAPLYAVSSPTLIATPADPLGAVVLTLIHHDRGCTVTSSGTGSDGDRGAQAFLDMWLEELAGATGGRVSRHDTYRTNATPPSAASTSPTK